MLDPEVIGKTFAEKILEINKAVGLGHYS